MKKTSTVAVVMMLLGCELPEASEPYAGENDGGYEVSGYLQESSCPQPEYVHGWVHLSDQTAYGSYEGGCVVTTSVSLDSLYIQSVCAGKTETFIGEFQANGFYGTTTIETPACSYTYEISGVRNDNY